jgi:hypothetical protein
LISIGREEETLVVVTVGADVDVEVEDAEEETEEGVFFFDDSEMLLEGFGSEEGVDSLVITTIS